MMRRMLDDAWRGVQGAELLVFHPKLLGALDMADALGIPAAMAVPAPFVVPTRRFPSAIVPPAWRLGGWFNRLSYQAAPLMTAAFSDVLYAWRLETLQAEHGVACAVEHLERIGAGG
jgi:sterol 3beta-glucosyltransferase